MDMLEEDLLALLGRWREVVLVAKRVIALSTSYSSYSSAEVSVATLEGCIKQLEEEVVDRRKRERIWCIRHGCWHTPAERMLEGR